MTTKKYMYIFYIFSDCTSESDFLCCLFEAYVKEEKVLGYFTSNSFCGALGFLLRLDVIWTLQVVDF